MRPNSALVFAQLLLLSAFAGRAASASNVQTLGGLTEQDPNNPVYKDLAIESLEVYVKQIGLTDPSIVMKIVKATTQVVAGVITRVDFVAKVGSSPTTCRSVILEKAWENIKKIDVTCDNLNKKSIKKRGILGGQNEEDPNDPVYTQLAKDSLQKYAAESGVIQPYEILRVNKVTKKVVAGLITRIDFEARSVDSHDIICHSEIWEQPWVGSKRINVNCDNVLYNF